MKGYAVVALYCVLFIAVQCHHHSKHSDDGPVYDGLNSILSDAHEHAQLILDDLTQRMNETFNSIKEKVDKLKDNNTFTEEIESLKTQDDVVQKCLKEHELAIAQFMRKLVNTYDSCSKEVKQEVNDLVEKIKEHVATIKDAPKEIETITKECLSQEERNPAASVLCVVTRVAEVQEEVFVANQSVEHFIDHGLEDVQTYADNKCDGVDDLKKEFESLFEKIQTCVEKAKQ